MSTAETLARHERAVLQFSGGKDSLACLALMRPYWDAITVLWINSGDAFPETVAQMAAIRAMVPHFEAVQANQPAQIERDGYPSDIVSVWDTPLGRSAYRDRPFKTQSALACCNVNLWQPGMAAVKALGATLVIRGQRHSEARRSGLTSGDVVDGIEYLLPIETWDDAAVHAYLAAQGIALPEHYDYVDSSLDCQHCTAYLDDNAGKFAYLAARHPSLHAEVRGRVIYLLRAARAEAAHLRAIVE